MGVLPLASLRDRRINLPFVVREKRGGFAAHPSFIVRPVKSLALDALLANHHDAPASGQQVPVVERLARCAVVHRDRHDVAIEYQTDESGEVVGICRVLDKLAEVLGCGFFVVVRVADGCVAHVSWFVLVVVCGLAPIFRAQNRKSPIRGIIAGSRFVEDSVEGCSLRLVKAGSVEVVLSLNLGLDLLQQNGHRAALERPIGSVGVVLVEDADEIRGSRGPRQPHPSASLHMHLGRLVGVDEREETQPTAGQVSLARDCHSASVV